jgi:hypothetical protein
MGPGGLENACRGHKLGAPGSGGSKRVLGVRKQVVVVERGGKRVEMGGGACHVTQVL